MGTGIENTVSLQATMKKQTYEPWEYPRLRQASLPNMTSSTSVKPALCDKRCLSTIMHVVVLVCSLTFFGSSTSLGRKVAAACTDSFPCKTKRPG